MTQRPDFFDLNDIALMARVAQKPYDPKSDSDIASGNEIKDGLWNKTIYWHNEVLKRLDGFSGQRPRPLAATVMDVRCFRPESTYYGL